MQVGIAKETFAGERRVAVVPGVVPSLVKAGLDVVIESGAGVEAGYADHAYTEKGAHIVPDRAAALAADIVLAVRALGANRQHAARELSEFRSGQTVIACCEPLAECELMQRAAAAGLSLLAMELIPRVTRAQSMDALSSMASIAGYKSVLLAGEALPKLFPMMMTAAGTITPARVFVIGAGVAGLQAIATARRLGAVVAAYDVRPAVKQEVESVGGRFVELPLAAEGAADQQGYARQLDEDFYRRQREMMLKSVAEADVVICTAAVPGKKAPVLVTDEMVAAMAPGSLVVDLAAERGGNCEATRAGQRVVKDGVVILGPVNLPATVPFHASQMYAKNITTLLLHAVTDGALELDSQDEIIGETLVCRAGELVAPRVREIVSASTIGQSNEGN